MVLKGKENTASMQEYIENLNSERQPQPGSSYAGLYEYKKRRAAELESMTIKGAVEQIKRGFTPDAHHDIQNVNSKYEKALLLDLTTYAMEQGIELNSTNNSDNNFMLDALTSVWFKIAMGLLILAATAFILVALAPVSLPVIGAIGVAMVGYLGLQLALGLGAAGALVGVSGLITSSCMSNSDNDDDDYDPLENAQTFRV